ncbi:hypothetical protein HK100_003737 [Physocladia obscura]|uniref:Lipase-like C-terminal domain-containing protein n=1 Tax=Physocladia obscura TaxID=109957 RepID=A0AAD5SVT9_9FUNG|nr:hypothetical protein HK100_003737 [Physocladia obscura]
MAVQQVFLGLGDYNGNPLAQKWGTLGNSYPTVFLHGLLGWGEQPLLDVFHYWGGASQNVLAELRTAGHFVVAPAMGPLSSNWERACEAYAQITGSATDYGIARSSRFGHSRFGKVHSAPLVPGFMDTPLSKINLVGHSMGGPTQRLLAHLLTYGSADEMDACIQANSECSPLFWTNKTTSYVNGVFAVSGVHQGSVNTDIKQVNKDHLAAYKEYVLALIALDQFDGIDIYDMQLSHWNLTQDANEPFFDFLARVLGSQWANENSNGMFDLSTASLSNPLISFVKNSETTFYFSVTGLTTYYQNGTSYPKESTSSCLLDSAKLIGSYNNTDFPVLRTYTPQDWRQNDGSVATASARGPESGFIDFSLDMRSNSDDTLAFSAPNSPPIKGIYNFVGVLDNTDHLQITGVAVLDERTVLFKNIMTVLSALPPN